MGKKTKEKLAKRVGVYQLKAFKNTNTAQIKVIGYVNEGEKFSDEKIEYGKNRMSDGASGLKIMDDVYVVMYKCNVTDAFIITNKKLPIMYAAIMYQRPFTTGFLFSVNIFFEITTDTQTVKSVSQLLSMTLE